MKFQFSGNEPDRFLKTHPLIKDRQRWTWALNKLWLSFRLCNWPQHTIPQHLAFVWNHLHLLFLFSSTVSPNSNSIYFTTNIFNHLNWNPSKFSNSFMFSAGDHCWTVFHDAGHLFLLSFKIKNLRKFQFALPFTSSRISTFQWFIFIEILLLPMIRCDTFIVYGNDKDDFSDDCTNPITRFFMKIEIFDIWDYLFVSLSLDFL